jgi:tetratricopeptide (TPR) repeat protein
MCISPQSAEFDRSMERLVDYGRRIALGDGDPRTFLEYAEALWDVRDLQATVAALDRAIEGRSMLSERELTRAYASRSICHLQMANLSEAEADATASLAVMMRAHPLGLRAIIHLHQGKTADALRDAQEAFRLDPDDWEVRAWRGMILLETGRFAEALDDFNWVIESGECVRYASEVYLARARAELAVGDPEAAESDCSQAIDLDYHEQAHWPFIVRSRVQQAQNAYLTRARARLALGRIPRALGDCCFAASIAPGDPAVYELRASVYHALGNVREAVADMIRADVLRRSSADAQPVLAARDRTGLTAEAVAA